jgi:outer membrane protein
MRIRWPFLLGVFVIAMVGPASGIWAADAIKPLSLPESIEIALKRSVLLHAAKEGVRGAEAQQKEAFTGFLPKFSTSYNYTRLNEDPYFVFPGAPPLIPAGNMKTGTEDNYSWTIEARQPLFAGGGISANYEAKRLGTDIARHEETTALQDLVQEVKVAYFNILKAERILDVAKQSVERLKAHRETAQGFYDVGLIPKNDLLYAEVELANGRQFLVRAENGVEMAKAKFNTILRREINAPLEIEDILNERPYEKSLQTCIAEALENRPEIRAHALRLEQARSIVKLSKSEYYPNVSLVGNYAKYGDTPGVAGSPYKDQESWYLMAVMNWTFWEWGRTKHRVDAGFSLESQAADILANIKDQITLEVKNAWILMNEAEKQVETARTSIEQAEENFRINTERYREQVGTSTDVIDAQTLLTKARSDYFNALGDVGIGGARLERAMGVAVRNRMK